MVKYNFSLNKIIVHFQIKKKCFASKDGYLLLNSYPIGGFFGSVYIFHRVVNYLSKSVWSTKIRIGPPNIWISSIMLLRKSNRSNSYRNITLLFAILFFIVKCALISVKYLIKFGIKHFWIYLFQPVMWRLTSHWLIKKKLSLKLYMKCVFHCHIIG